MEQQIPGGIGTKKKREKYILPPLKALSAPELVGAEKILAERLRDWKNLKANKNTTLLIAKIFTPKNKKHLEYF
jgi:hypothetical protein